MYMREREREMRGVTVDYGPQTLRGQDHSQCPTVQLHSSKAGASQLWPRTGFGAPAKWSWVWGSSEALPVHITTYLLPFPPRNLCAELSGAMCGRSGCLMRRFAKIGCEDGRLWCRMARLCHCCAQYHYVGALWIVGWRPLL